MRVNLRRRIGLVAALIVPAVAVLTMSASPALAAIPRYGRLVLGTPHALSPLAMLVIALGTAAGMGLLIVISRRKYPVLQTTVSPMPLAAALPADAADEGRKAA
jgi:hypothetical protein